MVIYFSQLFCFTYLMENYYRSGLDIFLGDYNSKQQPELETHSFL